MSEAKIAFLLERIEFIEKIVQRHSSITKALEDEIEARAAILMHFAQIGEELRKLDPKLLEQAELVEDAQGAYDTRNFIVHTYEGVNLALIEKIIRYKLPQLKEKLQRLLDA